MFMLNTNTFESCSSSLADMSLLILMLNDMESVGHP